MAIISYWPEMGQTKPQNVVGNVQLAYGRGCHYFVETPLTLSGVGVKLVEVITSESLTPQGHYKAGWNRYWVTRRALDTLEKQHNFAREALLD